MGCEFGNFESDCADPQGSSGDTPGERIGLARFGQNASVVANLLLDLGLHLEEFLSKTAFTLRNQAAKPFRYLMEVRNCGF